MNFVCDWKKLAIFTVLMVIVAQVVHVVEALLTMNYYLDPVYFQVWSKVMMPTAGPPPSSFYLISLLFAVITWVFFGIVYEKLSGALTEKDALKKGVLFGGLMYLVAGIPMILVMYLLVNVPVGILIAWAISALVLDLIAGIMAAKIYGGK
ncbi:hypothetical protein HY990_01730 [Candidatus Micrarchaeota archaeon]|nr:hypothetical protein [Candidatus Micrarchaeota archaeon]